MTARTTDANGWFEVAKNPLSKVGVFAYSGRQLGLTGDAANRVFQVLRPPEELGSPETLDSFRLLPLIDDHTMLGAADMGRTPAEKKGVHGVIGDNVSFDGRTLWGNLKVFSQDLASRIKSGKRELSCGYGCVYDFTPGEFDGKAYDAVQRRLRGNHVALVDQGRMGPDVAVLDQMTFTVDAKDLEPMRKTLLLATAAHAAALAASVPQAVLDACDAVMKAAKDDDDTDGADAKVAAAEKVAADAKAALKVAEDALTAAQTETKVAKDALAASGQDGADALTKALTDLAAARGEIAALKTAPAAMDEATLFANIGKRDALASRIATHVGTFDHASMTLDAVAAYGLDKLGLKDIPKGHELTALDSYLSAKPAPAPVTIVDAKDAAPVGAIAAYLNPPAA